MSYSTANHHECQAASTALISMLSGVFPYSRVVSRKSGFPPFSVFMTCIMSVLSVVMRYFDSQRYSNQLVQANIGVISMPDPKRLSSHASSMTNAEQSPICSPEGSVLNVSANSNRESSSVIMVMHFTGV